KLAFANCEFDAAISVFGVILFPDSDAGMRELRRVVRPGGKVAVVTWTQPQNYELAAELRAAAASVRGGGAQPSALPAQLRFRERADFEKLFQEAGFNSISISEHTAAMTAPSARWLSARLAFAPGMTATLNGLGSDAPATLDHFVASIEKKQ